MERIATSILEINSEYLQEWIEISSHRGRASMAVSLSEDSGEAHVPNLLTLRNDDLLRTLVESHDVNALSDDPDALELNLAIHLNYFRVVSLEIELCNQRSDCECDVVQDQFGVLVLVGAFQAIFED